MKVIVFQAPSGTRPITLTPRGARPLRRTMLVVTAVSSRNTSLAGSSRPCSRIQRRRARATSARSRSAACKLFFKAEVVPLEKTRERAAAGPNAVPSELSNSFFQGQIRLLCNHRHYSFRLLFQWRNATPRGFGAALLHSFQRCIHLTTELTLIPKCSAASCRDAPASTISITRSRRSQEYDLGIGTPRVRESMPKQWLISNRLGILPIQIGREPL